MSREEREKQLHALIQTKNGRSSSLDLYMQAMNIPLRTTPASDLTISKMISAILDHVYPQEK